MEKNCLGLNFNINENLMHMANEITDFQVSLSAVVLQATLPLSASGIVLVEKK